MRILPIIAMALLLSGCGSIISRTVPGQGHGNQYYPGVQWDVRDSAWRYLTILDLPF
ncbi:YceK/YidQ family lipoprotein [Klebsiella pneumoniae]